MNREIKFRAWCEGKHDNFTFTKPKMEYGISLSTDGHYLLVEGGWDIQAELKSIPIMQYTGLKDKNGKEIYEGDIIAFTENGAHCKTLAAIVWKDYEFIGKEIEYYNWRTYAWRSKKKLEVVGNIYENENLIKKENNG